MRLWNVWFSAAIALSIGSASLADTIRVGVASNFSATFAKIEKAFESHSEHKLVELSGSSGKLFAQIYHGAPIDVFLAADSTRPAKLEALGLALKNSRFTYALGHLALWSAVTDVPLNQSTLSDVPFHYLAIANPGIAPYGEAAVEVITNLKLIDTIRGRIVRGENVSQAMHYVATGNADFGFVALSQALAVSGSYWRVPNKLHRPIQQQAVVITHSQAADDFVNFLKSEPVQEILQASGYSAP